MGKTSPEDIKAKRQRVDQVMLSAVELSDLHNTDETLETEALEEMEQWAKQPDGPEDDVQDNYSFEKQKEIESLLEQGTYEVMSRQEALAQIQDSP